MANPGDDRFAFSASGSFQVSRDGERLSLIAAVLGLFLLLSANAAYFVLQVVKMVSEAGWLYGLRAILMVNLPWVAVLLAVSAVEILLFRAVRTAIFHGVPYYYFADETFFTFRCPEKRVHLSVRYEDVVAVTYRKRRALWYPRGYTALVTLTDERVLVFRCITSEKTADCDRVLKIPPAFRLLEERIDKMRRDRGAENFGRLPY